MSRAQMELLAQAGEALDPGQSLFRDDTPRCVRQVVEVNQSTPQRPSSDPNSLLAALPWLWSRLLFAGESPRAGRPRLIAMFWLLLLPAVVLYPCLLFHLFEPDEGRYAQIPFEMLMRGEWLIPYLQGQPYLDKPPLFYWLVMGSYTVFGVHDWAARLVPALSVHGTILLVYVFGCRRLGERFALWGALTLLLMPGFLGMARLLVMDGLLTFLVTLALFGLWEAVQPSGKAPGSGWGWWLTAGIACGLGILCKGPIILILILPPLWLHLLLTRTRPRWSWPNVALFASTMLAVALPWYIAICVRMPDFARYFLWQHNVQRFIQPFDHIEPVWYYVPILLPCLLPASLLLIPLAWSLLTRGQEVARHRPPEMGFLLLAGVWCVLFFSLSGSKLPTYILPAFPPLALALGSYLTLNGWDRSRWVRSIGAAAYGLLIASHFVLMPRFAELRSPMQYAALVTAECQDAAVPVVCHPHSLDSVSFYLGRDDLHAYRGKDAQQLFRLLDQHPRVVVLFCTHDAAESLRLLLPPHLRMTPATLMGMYAMAVIERKDHNELRP